MTNKNNKYHNLKNPEELAHELSRINKENNFRVPKNYFDELPQNIQERVVREKHRVSMDNLFVYFRKPYSVFAIGSFVAAIFLVLFLVFNQHQKELQFSGDISFEDIMFEYPDMIEYMDEQILIEFAAAQMTQEEIDMMDYEFEFDSILFQNVELENLTDEEITEIIYNL